MRLHIEYGEIEAALDVYRKSSKSLADWQPRETDWIDLIEAILDQSHWNEAVLVMREYCRKSARPSPRVKLKLAQILIQKVDRPVQGLKVLAEIRQASLPESLKMTYRQLAHQAEQMRDDEDGTLELEEETW